MEVTPISLRDVPVSSGVGAKPHGRDTSPPKMETESKVDAVKPRREIPVDLAEIRLAQSLQRSDPTMDAVTAARIAKLMMEGPASPKWETKADQQSPAEPVAHLDEMA